MDNTPTDTPLSIAERLDALEYVIGHALLALEADSVAKAERIQMLESIIRNAAPHALPPETAAEADEAFTLDSLQQWVGACLQAMRNHQSLPVRQIVAIGDTATRVLGLGDQLAPLAPADASTRAAAHAALQKAQHRPPRP